MKKFESVYGIKHSPIYIYSPIWTSASAGIRALHFLCHALNYHGFPSYLILATNASKGYSPVNSELITPVLTQEMADEHFRANKKPITIYSETIPGNPLNAQFVVRYLMNFVGDLGGPKSYSDQDFILSYSRNISEDFRIKTGRSVDAELFLPAIDPREFIEEESSKKGNHYLLYAGKYRALHGKPPEVNKPELIEIRRDGRHAQSRQELIELIKSAKAVISVENSSIITEAVLAGTPGLFLPNDTLKSAIAEHELGWGGTAWGIEHDSEAQARASLQKGKEVYFERISDFISALHPLVSTLYTKSSAVDYSSKIRVPQNKRLVNRHRLYLARQIIASSGVKTFLMVLRNFMRRRLAKRF